MKHRNFVRLQCMLCLLLLLGAIGMRRQAPDRFSQMRTRYLTWFTQQPEPEEPIRFAAAPQVNA